MHTLEKFQGKGRVILTASDATQYSFEGNQIIGQGTRSVFTRFLVEGLETGGADLDKDGDISLDELYSYVYDRIVENAPQQRPKKYENIEGRIVVARNIHWDLPAYLRNAIESPIVMERLGALEHLAQLYRVGNGMVRANVINHIRHLTNDDSKQVAAAAIAHFERLYPEHLSRDPEGQDQREIAKWTAPSWRPNQSTAPSTAKPTMPTRARKTHGKWPPRRTLGWAAGVLLLVATGTTAVIHLENPQKNSTIATTIALPQTRAAVPHGELIYQAAMDGTGKSFVDLVGRSHDPSQAAVTFKPGALELAALAKNSDAGTDLKLNQGVITFVGDIDLSVKPGSDVQFCWGLRWAIQGKLAYELCVDTAAQFVQFTVWNGENNVPISPRIDITDLQSGRTVPMTVVVEKTHLTLYVDSRKVADVEDRQVPPTHTAPGLDVYSYDGTGTVSVHSLRLYQLATG